MIYHAATQLPNGRLSWIIDPGAWQNLIGAVLAKKIAQACIKAGLTPTEAKRQAPLVVAGVGNGTQQADYDVTFPLALTDRDDDTGLHNITAPVVEGAGENLPGLLGLSSLERNRAILDCGRRLLIIPGSDDYEYELPSTATVLPLEKAPSGHLVLPIDAYDKVKKKGGLQEKPLHLLADTSNGPTPGTLHHPTPGEPKKAANRPKSHSPTRAHPAASSSSSH